MFLVYELQTTGDFPKGTAGAAFRACERAVAFSEGDGGGDGYAGTHTSAVPGTCVAVATEAVGNTAVEVCREGMMVGNRLSVEAVTV